MSEACELVQTVESVTEMVMLNKDKIKLKLGGTEKYASVVWYLDTRANNHMTGCSEKFTKLDTSVIDTVKFGDGPVVEICGHGTVLF